MHFSTPVIILATFLKRRLKQYIVTYLATSQTIWNFRLHLRGGGKLGGGNPSNKLEKQIHLLNSPSGSAHSTSGTKKNPTKLNSTNQLFIVNYSLSSIPNTAKICLFIFIWSLKKIHCNIAVCLCSSTKSGPTLLFWMPLFNQRKAIEQERTKAKFSEEKIACVCNVSFHCVW